MLALRTDAQRCFIPGEAADRAWPSRVSKLKALERLGCRGGCPHSEPRTRLHTTCSCVG